MINNINRATYKYREMLDKLDELRPSICGYEAKKNLNELYDYCRQQISNAYAPGRRYYNEPQKKHVVIVGKHEVVIAWLKDNNFLQGQGYTIVTCERDMFKVRGLRGYDVVEVYGYNNVPGICRLEIYERSHDQYKYNNLLQPQVS